MTPRMGASGTPEGTNMADDKIKAKIAHELYEAVRKMDANSDLLSIIGSYGDTLGDEEVLDRLREWNSAHEDSFTRREDPAADPPRYPPREKI